MAAAQLTQDGILISPAHADHPAASASLFCLPLGLFKRSSKNDAYTVPFHNVLWAEPAAHNDRAVILDFTRPASRNKKSADKISPVRMQLEFVGMNFHATNTGNSGNTALQHDASTLASKTSKDTMSTHSSTSTAYSPSHHDSSAHKTPASAAALCDLILAKAYPPGTTRAKRLLVVINPHSGQGHARHIYESVAHPIFERSRCHLTVFETEYQGHALEFAKTTPALADRFDAVVCCSGDGIPHELINGFALRSEHGHADAQQCLTGLPICQLPCGSGNSMAVSLNGSPSPSLAALAIVKGRPMPVDLMLLTQGATASLSFLSQSIGTIADADLGTDPLRFLGPARFVLGTLYFTLKGKNYPCDIDVKYAHPTKAAVKAHYDHSLASEKSAVVPASDVLTPVYGTAAEPVPADWTPVPAADKLSILYAGKLPWITADTLMFPAALPADGTLDLFLTRTADIGPFASVKMLLGLEQGKHLADPRTNYAKATAYRVTPKGRKEKKVAVDGERYNGLEPFQVEVRPSAGCVLSCTGRYAQTGF